MAELITVELVRMIVQDVYLVSKWSYKTYCAAQPETQLAVKAGLQDRFAAQLAIIKGFAHFFLTDLPANDPNKESWLPDVKIKFVELQKLLTPSYAKLALEGDQEYREFCRKYAFALTSGNIPQSLANGGVQWLIEDAISSTSVVPSHADQVPHSEASVVHTPLTPDSTPPRVQQNSILVSHSKLHGLHGLKEAFTGTLKETGKSIVRLGASSKNHAKDIKARYAFAIWEEDSIRSMLDQMESIIDRLLLRVPFISLRHPKFDPERVAHAQAQAFMDRMMQQPEMRAAAQMIGVLNLSGIRGVIEQKENSRIVEVNADDSDADIQPHSQRLLESIPITVESLPWKGLLPEDCDKLSKGTLTDTEDAPHDVLVEYKGWKSTDDKGFVVERRRDIQSLLKVLALAKSPFFPNLLKLRGYIPQEGRCRYAFIFDFPADSSHEQPLSLQEIICDESAMGADYLDIRYKMALELAKSVGALLAAGWVHQSISSDSVVIFRDAESRLAYEKPYLVNFRYSRPAGSATQYDSASAQEHLLYQHPERLQRKPSKYTKKHDLYSLGVVLLEIGLWRSAKKMCISNNKPNSIPVAASTSVNKVDSCQTDSQPSHREIYLELADQKLGRRMGGAYRKVVISLLSDSAFAPGSGSRAGLDLIEEVINVCETFGRAS